MRHRRTQQTGCQAIGFFDQPPADVRLSRRTGCPFGIFRVTKRLSMRCDMGWLWMSPRTTQHHLTQRHRRQAHHRRASPLHPEGASPPLVLKILASFPPRRIEYAGPRAPGCAIRRHAPGLAHAFPGRGAAVAVSGQTSAGVKAAVAGRAGAGRPEERGGYLPADVRKGTGSPLELALPQALHLVEQAGGGRAMQIRSAWTL